MIPSRAKSRSSSGKIGSRPRIPGGEQLQMISKYDSTKKEHTARLRGQLRIQKGRCSFGNQERERVSAVHRRGGLSLLQLARQWPFLPGTHWSCKHLPNSIDCVIFDKNFELQIVILDESINDSLVDMMMGKWFQQRISYRMIELS